MFDVRRIPIVRILLPFAGGSLAGQFLECGASLPYAMMASLLVWIILILLHNWLTKRSGVARIIFSKLAFFQFLGLGILAAWITLPKDPDLPLESKVMIRGTVLEDPQPGYRNWVFAMKLLLLASDEESFSKQSRLTVYMGMPSDSILPAAGEIWI